MSAPRVLLRAGASLTAQAEGEAAAAELAAQGWAMAAPGDAEVALTVGRPAPGQQHDVPPALPTVHFAVEGPGSWAAARGAAALALLQPRDRWVLAAGGVWPARVEEVGSLLVPALQRLRRGRAEARARFVRGSGFRVTPRRRLVLVLAPVRSGNRLLRRLWPGRVRALARAAGRSPRVVPWILAGRADQVPHLFWVPGALGVHVITGSALHALVAADLVVAEASPLTARLREAGLAVWEGSAERPELAAALSDPQRLDALAPRPADTAASGGALRLAALLAAAATPGR